MTKHPILEKPSVRYREEFLAAVAQSRKLHREWASPPRTEKQFFESLKRLQSQSHIGYWVRTEDGQLAGVININEIVRGRFCSGYLGYYALVPHNGRGVHEERASRSDFGSIWEAQTSSSRGKHPTG